MSSYKRLMSLCTTHHHFSDVQQALDGRFVSIHLQLSIQTNYRLKLHVLTRSLAAGFGRHGMPPPASNDAAQHSAKTDQTDHVTLRP